MTKDDWIWALFLLMFLSVLTILSWLFAEPTPAYFCADYTANGECMQYLPDEPTPQYTQPPTQYPYVNPWPNGQQPNQLQEMRREQDRAMQFFYQQQLRQQLQQNQFNQQPQKHFPCPPMAVGITC